MLDRTDALFDDAVQQRAKVGDEIACAGCRAPIIKTSPNRSICSSCLIARRIARKRSKYRDTDGRTKLQRLIACERCGTEVARTGGTKKFCKPCGAERTREVRAAYRDRSRPAHVEKVKGTTSACEHCGADYIRGGVSARFCPTCRPIIWKLDPKRMISLRLGNAIRKSLGSEKRGRRWEGLVGFTLEELRRHIERQFTPGMTWANWGSWHIDHVLPLSSFSFCNADDPEFKAAWALTNLRPLWAPENLSKQARRTLLL